MRRVLRVMIDKTGLWEDVLNAICRIWIGLCRILMEMPLREGCNAGDSQPHFTKAGNGRDRFERAGIYPGCG